LKNSNPRAAPLLLINVCWQLASALGFLKEKGVIHRDLAARNVLVGSSLENVKLADFGMSKSLDAKLYYRKVESEKVPVKWLAPECLQKKLFTHESDVWSYGVVVWEVFSHGTTPYAGMTGLETAMAVGIGSRLPQPRDCPDEVYQLVLRMWSFDPEQRVSVAEIQDSLVHALTADASTRSQSYFHSEAGDQPPTSPRSLSIAGASENPEFVCEDPEEGFPITNYVFVGQAGNGMVPGALATKGNRGNAQRSYVNQRGVQRPREASSISSYSTSISSPTAGKAAGGPPHDPHDPHSYVYQYSIETLKDQCNSNHSSSNERSTTPQRTLSTTYTEFSENGAGLVMLSDSLHTLAASDTHAVQPFDVVDGTSAARDGTPSGAVPYNPDAPSMTVLMSTSVV